MDSHEDDTIPSTTNLLTPIACTLSRAVQAVPALLPDMNPMSADPALTASEQHKLAQEDDVAPVANGIKRPTIVDDSHARLPTSSTKSSGAEIVESEDGTPAEDVVDEAVLEDLKAASLGEEQLVNEPVSMSTLEGESSSETVSNIEVDRESDGNYITQELPGDWLGVQDATSSLNTLVQETHASDYSPVTTSNSREIATERACAFPLRTDEVLAAEEEGVSQILTWPVGLAIEVIGFQVKLVLHTIYFSLWLCSFSVSVITFPFRTALKATNVVTTTVGDGYTVATQLKPMVTEGVAQAGPVLKQTTKKCGFGCLAAIYVMFMLGSLLVPALFLDLFLMRGIIDVPVEFREILHFDYRQERPSAIVSLLPPKVLDEVEGNVYPEKVLRARAIPSSHKLQVTVFLTLPESHYNRQLGMFQVSAELLSVRGQVLKRASWPCMLPFQSSPIRYAKQIILGVPLAMGLSMESHMLGLRLFENEDEKATATAMVRFILEPKAGFPSGQGLPEVYSAEAQVLSVLPWPKDLLRRWKWVLYIWSGLSLFLFEVMIVLCCCHQVLLPSRLLQGITEGFGESEFIVKETPEKRVGKQNRLGNSDELPTARAIMEPTIAVDKVKGRELLSNAESTSSLSGPRLRRLSGSSAGNDDVRSEASSSWRSPSLKTLDNVGGKAEAVEGSVRSLGETVVEGATEGMGLALHKFRGVLDPKTFKSD